jgi:hypothetical protein
VTGIVVCNFSKIQDSVGLIPICELCVVDTSCMIDHNYLVNETKLETFRATSFKTSKHLVSSFQTIYKLSSQKHLSKQLTVSRVMKPSCSMKSCENKKLHLEHQSHDYVVNLPISVVIFSSMGKSASCDSSPHLCRHWISLKKLFPFPLQPP